MAGKSQSEVDLVIKAKDLSTKVLKDTEAAISEVTSALGDQAKQAGKAGASLDALETGLKGLSKAEAEVAKQQTALDKALDSTANTLDRATTRQTAFAQGLARSKSDLAEARASAAAAAEAYSEYANSLGAADTVTKAQQRTLDGLAKAVDKADAAVAKASQNVVGYSISQRNAVDQVQRLVAIQQQLESSQQALAVAADRAAKAQAAQRDELKAAAEAHRQAAEAAERHAAAERKAVEEQEKARARARAVLTDDTQGQRTTVIAQGSQAVKDTQGAIAGANAALSEQARLAQQADASVEDLSKSLKGLTKNEAELTKQQNAIDKALASTAASMDQAAAREQNLADQLGRLNGQIFEQTKQAQLAARAWELFANDINQFGPPTREASDQLRAVSAQMARANATAADLASEVSDTKSAMAAAKTATNDLAAAQKTLASTQAQVAASLNAVQAGHAAQKTQIDAVREANKQADEQAREAKKAAKKAEEDEAVARRKNTDALDLFTKGQRESLSWYQRLRGEVIALATAYVGLQGALGVAKDSLDAFSQRQQTQNVLGVAIGSNDPKEIAQEFDYVRGVADRLGFRVKDLAKQYSAFSVAARTAGASSEETRFIFEQVSKATRVLGLSTDDAKGVFLALQQMFSKGKISAEELRQQLGERLPGAVAILTKALNLKPGQLDKMLEKGTIGADRVLDLAKGIGDTFGKNLGPAIEGLNAEWGRFLTSVDDFKLAIADAGFATAFTKFLRELTAFFKSDDGKKFATQLSDAFTQVLGVLRFLIDNFNTIKDVLAIIIAIKVGQFFLSLATNATKAAVMIIEMNAAMTATGPAGAAAAIGIDATTTASTRLVTALGAVQKLMLWLTAFAAGWEIGELLDRKFKVVHDASQWVADKIVEGWINVKHGVVVFAAEMTQSVLESFDRAIKGIKGLKNGFLGGLSTVAKKMGLDGIGDSIAEGITEGVTSGLEDAIDAAKMAAQAARQLRDRELSLSRAARGYSPVQLTGSAQSRIKTGAFVETPKPAKSTVPVAPPDNSKEIAKREKLEESLSSKLNAINQKTDKNYKDSLADRIDATERSFKDIEDTVAKFRKAGGKDVDGVPLDQVVKQIAAMKDVAVEQEIVKFNTEQLASGEKEVNDLLAERKNRIAEVTSDQKDGLIDVGTAFERIKAINDEMTPQIRKAADLTAGFAAGLKGTTIDTGNRLDALISKMQKVGNEMRQGGPNSATGSDGIAAFNLAMQETNNILQQRNAEVATYNDLVKLGAITQTDANDKIKAAFDATQPQINKAVDGMRAMLQAMQDAGTIAPDKFNALNAQLTLLSTNAQYVDRDIARIKDAFESSFSQGFQEVINSLGDSLVGLAKGTLSWGDAFRNLGRVALTALGNIAQAVANAITQMIALKIASSILSSFGGAGAAAGAGSGVVVGGAMNIAPIVATPIPHGGGIVGPAGMSGAGGNRSRSVSASWFAGAPRYHSGGVIGLRGDEQAAILQRGEEVLSKDNPRNIMNQTRDAVGQAGSGVAIRNVLVTDPNMIPDAMQSSQGEKTLITVIGRNRAKVRKMLGF